jgi:glycosyltransferase involved in cell wall biosynthesis
VPAYNEGMVIQPALRSLLLLDYPNYEVLVIDDGSSDDTYEKSLGFTETKENMESLTRFCADYVEERTSYPVAAD